MPCIIIRYSMATFQMIAYVYILECILGDKKIKLNTRNDFLGILGTIQGILVLMFCNIYLIFNL